MLSSCTHAKECSVQQCLQLPKLESTQLAISITTDKYRYLYIQVMASQLEATQLAISITTDKYRYLYIQVMASQVVLVVKNPLASSGDTRDVGLIPGLGNCRHCCTEHSLACVHELSMYLIEKLLGQSHVHCPLH